MWEILQEKVYKTRITALQLSVIPLTNDCFNDDMIQLGPLRSQSLYQLVQINDAYFAHFLLQHWPHAVINHIQIWQIWGSTLRWHYNRHYSGEVENVYTILQQIYSENSEPNFIRIARVL